MAQHSVRPSNGTPTSPAVRPAEDLTWSHKDELWLNGGKRLHMALGLILLALMAIPAKIVDDGRSLRQRWEPATRPTDFEATGVYWRWTLQFALHDRNFSDPEIGRRYSYRRWPAILTPAAMGLLALGSILFRGRVRAAMLCLAGALPVIFPPGRLVHFPIAAVLQYDPPPILMREHGRGFSGPDNLAAAAFFDQVDLLLLLLVAAAGHRAVMRGAAGPLRRFVTLAAVLPLFVPLAVIACIQLAAGNSQGLFGPRTEGVQKLAALWPWTFAACRLLMFVFGLVTLANCFTADRRIAAAGWICGAVCLASVVSIAVTPALDVMLRILEMGPRYDRMLNAGVILQRLLPVSVGMVLWIGGFSRLIVALGRPRREGMP